MNLKNIITLLQQGIPEDRIRITKKQLMSFRNKGFVTSLDLIPINGNYRIEGAVKLRIYSHIIKFGIPYSRINELEKEYRQGRMLTKELKLRDFSFTPTILSIPILKTLSDGRWYITLTENNILEYLSEEDIVGIISYGRDSGTSIHGRIFIDLGVILEDFGINIRSHSKGTINKMRKVFEQNNVSVLDKDGNYYSTTTNYYDHPRELPDKITTMLSKPNTSMYLKSNNNGVITHIVYKEKTKIE